MLSEPLGTEGARPIRKRTFIVVGMLLKLSIAVGVAHMQERPFTVSGVLAFAESGDAPEYLRLAEQYLSTGEYALDAADPDTRAHRMPGYLLPYLAYRRFATPTVAKLLLLVTQVALAGAALGLLAATVERAFSVREAWLALLIAGGAVGPSSYDLKILPDSLATSLGVLISSMVALGPVTAPCVALTGLLFAWAMFLRPFLAPLGLFLAVLWAMRAGAVAKGRRRRQAAILLAFSLPIVVAETVWLGRNYYWQARLEPFHTAGMRLAAPWRAYYDFTRSFGGDLVWWRPGTFGSWLMQHSMFHANASLPVPAVVLSESCTPEMLARARDDFNEYIRADPARGASGVGEPSAQIFNTCRNGYERSHPVDHWFVSRVRLVRQFFVHAGPTLPGGKWSQLAPGSLAWCLKLATAASHTLAWAVGLPVALVMLYASTVASRDVAVAKLALSVWPLYICAVFPLALRFVEGRYITTAYPYLHAAVAIAFVHAARIPGERRRTRSKGLD